MLKIEGNRAFLSSPIPKAWLMAAPLMEGMKAYLKGGGVSFEPTPWNIEIFRKHMPDVEISDTRPVENLFAEAGSGLQGVRSALPQSPTLYVPKTKPYAHQTRAFDKFGTLPYFALFAEQGTGKTKIMIDLAGKHWCELRISAVIIITLRGVHQQWIEEQLPTHLGGFVRHEGSNEEPTPIPWVGQAWNKDKPKFAPGMLDGEKLAVFSINVDALRTAKGEKAMRVFIEEHGGSILCLCDESQEIGNATSGRSEIARELAHMCALRGISTGTPIGKDLTNYWAQFLFLDEAIIGHRYETTFKTHHCVIGGWDNNTVVGGKNIEELYRRTDPYTFRATKDEELDLPPKVYDNVVFEMTAEQSRVYKELKEKFLADLESGDVATVKNAAVLLTRLQQISCGYIQDEDGTLHHFKTNPRLETLMRLRSARPGKRIIWARFNQDVEMIVKEIGASAVAYYGGTRSGERADAKAAWLDPSSGIDDFVASPAAGGTGLNLQGECRTNIYYSNSFNAIHRWQSEDRTHRIGTNGTVTYFDLIAARSVDRKIMSNLKAKKDLSDLVLDDIRKMLADE